MAIRGRAYPPSTRFLRPQVGQTFTSVSISPSSASLAVGANLTLTATALDQQGNPLAIQPTFTWSSANGSIATVGSSTGIVHGVAAGGPINITATSGSHSNHASITVTAAAVPYRQRIITIGPQAVKQRRLINAVPGRGMPAEARWFIAAPLIVPAGIPNEITLSPTPITVRSGMPVTVTPVVEDDYGTVLTGIALSAVSSNTGVFTVSPSSGTGTFTVTWVGPGAATLTVSVTALPTVSTTDAVTASGFLFPRQPIVVSRVAQQAALRARQVGRGRAARTQFAQPKPGVITEYIWTTANGTVVGVSPTGTSTALITRVAPGGPVNVTATRIGTSVSGSSSITCT